MLNIFPFKQSDNSRCGPACIKMVLGYYGIDALEEDICELCNWSYTSGCTGEDMKRAIEHYGFGCALLNHSTLEDIEYWIKHHIPVIVDWFSPGVNLSPGDMPNGHSSVVVDIDIENIYLLDPEDGKVRSIRRSDFLRVWFDWKETPIIADWNDMVLRQIMIVYPGLLYHRKNTDIVK